MSDYAHIIERLLEIAAELKERSTHDPISMHDIISEYNRRYDNTDLIGGAWVREHVPELADLP